MLSYRHSFHAGNFADVLKHIVQLLIIESLQQKEKGFLYLDTHAGAGLYSLQSFEAEKTAEFEQGVGYLWQRQDLPKTVKYYLDQVAKVNSQQKLRFYPGSPLLAANLLRPQDRAILTELHPCDYPLLRKNIQPYKNVQVKRDDGFQQLKAVLPPKERRGFILIDPPYELKEDYQLVVDTIVEGYKRFATGTYAIWYPVVLRQQIKKMVRALEETQIRKILQIELGIRPDTAQRGMTASGMIVINPPWKLEAQMKAILPYLTNVLAPEGTGHWELHWITPE
ncbi:ribosomal RNA large subunit methyltransferase J [Gallibacterium anatis]|uniref:23S rRNA (adenine(2030)-N(6))-methyltransferase RlmJ n=1 Tax=Gallibacterium anatis TaxID=750 RepID=UPI000530C1AD|nr:23S rRNA (adenine(2030)-N(6))-methyltransferase RlmJ [Gallibacterium anatis]KGQ42306.1 ribosomal RNA large subunit methyltransferase J [Gallibacterium anatis]KGQ59566.1 ribosomal RNA large subunit methyltransferase J [Gallibacterium anatis]KGQ65524.1 ribosomal RNA large subunit methyltransferase J [Gallibacterium anatis]